MCEHEAAATQGLEQPEKDEPGVLGAEYATGRTDDRNPQASEQQFLATQHVGKWAEEQLGESNADGEQADGQGDVRAGRAEIIRQGGEGRQDDVEGEAAEQDNCGQEQ